MFAVQATAIAVRTGVSTVHRVVYPHIDCAAQIVSPVNMLCKQSSQSGSAPATLIKANHDLLIVIGYIHGALNKSFVRPFLNPHAICTA